eukprot:317235_1
MADHEDVNTTTADDADIQPQEPEQVDKNENDAPQNEEEENKPDISAPSNADTNIEQEKPKNNEIDLVQESTSQPSQQPEQAEQEEQPTTPKSIESEDEVVAASHEITFKPPQSNDVIVVEAKIDHDNAIKQQEKK